MFGSLRTWGWVALIIGVLRLLAAAGVLAGSQLARWFGVAVLRLNALGQVSFLPACPFWSMIIAGAWSRCTGCAPTAAARTWPR